MATAVKITHFVPDECKAGGEYVVKVGTIKKLDLICRSIVLNDGAVIDMANIVEISHKDGKIKE